MKSGWKAMYLTVFFLNMFKIKNDMWEIIKVGKEMIFKCIYKDFRWFKEKKIEVKKIAEREKKRYIIDEIQSFRVFT